MAERSSRNKHRRGHVSGTGQISSDDSRANNDRPTSSAATTTTVFYDLQNRVLAAFTQELAKVTMKGNKLASTLSVKDIAFDESMTSCQPELQPLDILEDWNNLLMALREENVFTNYVDSLDRAFASLHLFDLTRGNIGRYVHVLLELLTQAVKEHARDKSIECRFVTLLEVLLSYNGTSWQPSTEVLAMWKRLMQRIPSNNSPVSFRRKAYRVLVSLSWVTSSKGLLEACSFEVSKHVSDFSIECIREHMASIRGGPLPRYDCVNQLLDRLKDETDVCVAITSEKEGLGKTTLAAQVASHPSILRVFTVLWLCVKEQDLNYKRYLKYLDELCKQLGFPYQSWPINVKRLEEPALRRLRERNYVSAAQAQMSQLVASHGRNVLLVLDDVRESEVIKWFRFDDRQSIIITTPHSNLSGVDWALELVPLSQDEAIELFVNEAGLPSNHMLGATIELRSIVRQCDFHPLLVRTIARWYKLKQVTAPMSIAVEEIMSDLTSLKESQSHQMLESEATEQDPNMLLFDVLCLMMGPARVKEPDYPPSALFLLCFSALVVVFPDGAPIDAVLLLWEQVLKMEVIAHEELIGSLRKDELRRHTWLMAEGLSHMGVIEVAESEGKSWVKVHHALYKDFAILMAKEMDLKETFQDTVADWHMAFVKGYIARKSRQGENEQQTATWRYTIEKLPSHMFDGKMLPTAELLLSEENFFRARITALGWRRGVDTQIEDCIAYQHEIDAIYERNNITDAPTSNVFQRISVLLRERRVGLAEVPRMDQAFEEASALYLLGFALAESGYCEEALEQLKYAESLSSSSSVLQASIYYAISWCYLSVNQSHLAKKKINASRKMMKEGPQSHNLYQELLQLHVDALVEGCDYQEAAGVLKQIVSELKASPAKNPIELGSALHRQGRLFYYMREYDSALATLDDCGSWKIKIGEVSMSLASVFGLLGDVNFELGMLGEAKDRYIAALQTLEALQCNAHSLDYCFLTGKMQFLDGDITRCKESFDLVRQAITTASLKPIQQSACDLRFIALAYEEIYGTNDSVAVLKESLLLTNECRVSLERSYCLLSMGNCWLKLGDNVEALKCYEKALQIQMTKLGESTEVVDTTNLTGSILVNIGDIDAAILRFQKNYEMTMRVAPDDIERVAGVLYLMGDAHKVRGSLEKSVSFYEKCLEVLRNERSVEDADVAKTLQRLGDVHLARKDLDTSFDYFSRALAIRSTYFDEGLVAETNHSLGVVETLRGRYESAYVFFDDALRVREKIGVAEDTVQILLEFGKVCLLLSKPERAMTHYFEGLALVTNDHPTYFALSLGIGHAKLVDGKYQEALVHYERIDTEASETCIDTDASETRAGYVSFYLGLSQFLLGDADNALQYLNEFLRHGEEELSRDVTCFVAFSNLLLGDIFDASNLNDQAKVAWEHCWSVCCNVKELSPVFPDCIVPMIERRLTSNDCRHGFLSPFSDNSSFEAIRYQEEMTLRNIPKFYP